jgi:MFS transporter, DHA2 family, multidrug resistance protein
MSAALASTSPARGYYAISIAALMAAYMDTVNISLPNAALPHIQGALSMADDEVGWVFTSYLAAGAIVMPMARWLAGRFGRKAIYQASLALFALALILDTLATTPIQLVLARIVQGAASGPLASLSLAILLDVLPPARHARITLGWSICLLLGLSTGAAIGGWLSEYHGWRSIFYFSLPMVGFIFMTMALWLPEKKTERNPPFDFFGLATLSLGIVGLQMALDRGERLEWFDSREIWLEALASALGFYLFIVHVLTKKEHFLNKALLRDRNFVLSTIAYFAVGFVLLPTLALTSPMLEDLLNYPVDTAGYMTIPRGVTLVGALTLMAFVPARIDTRPFLIAGIALVIYANWLMLSYSPAMDWWPVITALLLQGTGLGVSMAVLTKTAFSTIDPALRPEATAVFNMSRVYGGSIGVAVVLLFFYGNTQAMHLALAKDLTPYRAAAHVAGSIGAPGLATLNDMITSQAAVVAIIGQFKILMLAVLIVSPLTLFLRKSPAAG